MRRALALLGLIGALAAAPALAEGPADQQILGLSLGQRAADPNDMGGLQAAFGAVVAKDIEALALVEGPAPNYQIELSENRRLKLWFDPAANGRPIYCIELSQGYDPPPVPPDQYDRIIQDLGGWDFEIGGPTGAPLGVLLIKIDPSLSTERKAAIKHHIDEVVANRPKELGSRDDPFIEPGGNLQSWMDILGENFRGKTVSIYTISHRIDGTNTVLIDTAIARGVLARTQ
jgi:hypothetical protein